MDRFVYETHLHTNQASRCGQLSGAEMARLYHKAGYTGIVITDHFLGGNTAIDPQLPWEQWVESFCAGYADAKQEGDKLGLQVFFGWESGFKGTEFLVYGLDKQWLLDHPEIKGCTAQQQYELVHSGGGIVIHAHPFRVRPYIHEIRLFPDFVDGVEIYNGAQCSVAGPRSPEDVLATQQALDYAKEHDLPGTSGSDQHGSNLFGVGMVFSRKLQDIHDFTQAVLHREAVELLDGFAPMK